MRIEAVFGFKGIHASPEILKSNKQLGGVLTMWNNAQLP